MTERSWIRQYELYFLTRSPFTWLLGLSRTLLAVSTLLTLVVTPTSALFLQSTTNPAGPSCGGSARSLNLFCLSQDSGWIETSKLISIGVLLLVIIGLTPALTAIPHWYVSWSAATSFGLVDGGDHINSMLTALLLPILLFDRRTFHWSSDRTYALRRVFPKAMSHVGLLALSLQMSVLYLVASVSKVGVAEWADGTAVWYWLSDPTFGLPATLFSWAAPVLSHLFVVASLTYGVIVIELLAAVGPALVKKWRHRLFLLLLVFHFAIAIVMGLWTFGLSMAAGLLLSFIRPGEAPSLNFTLSSDAPPLSSTATPGTPDGR